MSLYRRRLMMGNQSKPLVIEDSFYKRTTANGVKVFPNASLISIKGNSGVWTNYNMAAANAIREWKSYTIDGNYFKGYLKAATTSMQFPRMSFVNVGNHEGIKAYIRADVYVSTSSIPYSRWGFGFTTGTGAVSGSFSDDSRRTVNQWHHSEKIITTTKSGSSYYNNIMFCVPNGSTQYNYPYAEDDYVEIKNLTIVNLTALFGAGNEPTAAQFREMFPLDNYDYKAGTLCSACPTDFVSRSRNIWDEVLEEGNINTSGENGTTTGVSRSKNYIPIKPNTRYYFSRSAGGGATYDFWAVYYDYNKTFISRSAAKCDFTTPENAYYMRFQNHSNYGVTYNSDICIAPYDEAKNGTYTPYFEDVINLDVTALKPNEGEIYQFYPITITENKYYNTTSATVGQVWNYATSSSSSGTACASISVKAGEVLSIWGKGAGTALYQYTLLDKNKVVLYKHEQSVNSRTTPTIVNIEQDGIAIVNFYQYDASTDKVGYEYNTLFPRGLKSGADAEGNIFRDEIYNDNGVWKGVLRVANTRTSNAVTLRNEYDALSQEEVYILDNQDIPSDFIVATNGIEEFIPNGEDNPPVSAPPVVKIKYWQ